MKLTMDKLTALCKNRGFIFAGSDIYGGLANSWDYGPLGVELINNIKRAWWKRFVQENEYVHGIDCAILMNTRVWEASGHVAGFSDPLIDCKSCKSRHRADDLVEAYSEKKKLGANVSAMSNDELNAFIAEHKVPCPVCGKSEFTTIKKFNLMFKTFQGVTEDSASTVYLRPETAQGIFVNFKNVLRSTRARVPFGVGQIGKAFRNEITPGNFVFRTREFEQMELEFFCKPGEDLQWFDYWKKYIGDFYADMGIRKENLRTRDHDKAELAFYSKATTDYEYLFPFGWGELCGLADRTDYDLKRHSDKSGEKLDYTDPVTNETYVPYVIEPSLGVARFALALLCDSYEEQQLENDTRVVLHLHPYIAPYKAAVLPLQKNLCERADKLYHELNKRFNCTYDVTASIGKRYRRQDEIGTPFCVTVDFDTLDSDTVTIRERDSMTQIRLSCDKVADYIDNATNSLKKA